jgi:hypothetical protein
MLFIPRGGYREFPRGVAVIGNPGVHLRVEYLPWSYEVLHQLTKEKFLSEWAEIYKFYAYDRFAV